MIIIKNRSQVIGINKRKQLCKNGNFWTILQQKVFESCNHHFNFNRMIAHLKISVKTADLILEDEKQNDNNCLSKNQTPEVS